MNLEVSEQVVQRIEVAMGHLRNLGMPVPFIEETIAIGWDAIATTLELMAKNLGGVHGARKDEPL